ncbi:HTH domain-containing protein [Vibrio agarivorans]|uniref:HTH domain-containing protein n=1 Tax=Vibrio agarivorans TaxID=153622 RepID=UPI0025B4D0F1|nr:HTH domain-containing protein [Vibrio agarivorans]MDN3659949.1 HTH domain-containing protein [Vibrio agarivorans]
MSFISERQAMLDHLKQSRQEMRTKVDRTTEKELQLSSWIAQIDSQTDEEYLKHEAAEPTGSAYAPQFLHEHMITALAVAGEHVAQGNYEATAVDALIATAIHHEIPDPERYALRVVGYPYTRAYACAKEAAKISPFLNELDQSHLGDLWVSAIDNPRTRVGRKLNQTITFAKQHSGNFHAGLRAMGNMELTHEVQDLRARMDSVESNVASMGKLNKITRREQVVKHHSRMTIAQMAEAFGATTRTIERDIAALREAGEIA